MERPKFHKGDAVAHIDNIGVKMRVKKLVFENNKEEEHKNKLMGIQASWWENNQLKESEFHSHELIPWGIAEEGQERVDSYIRNLENDFNIPQ